MHSAGYHHAPISRSTRMTFCVLTVSLLTTLFSSAAPAKPEMPDLVVVIAVDQLRRDRLDDDLPGGIGRMVRQGRVFTQAKLDHGVTSTCPGHAVMLTGVNPGRAGIPGNDYIDRDSWETRYCFDDSDDSTRVIDGEANRSPNNLRVDTLGDWLRNKYPGAKVMSVGGKDRAAIALGGHGPDRVFWFDKDLAKFTSSGYYMDALPDYVKAFNGTGPLTDGPLSDLPPTWEHETGPWRADDYPGEDDKYERYSPHPLGNGDSEAVVSQFWSSPWQDKAALRLARTLIEAERLGVDESPDLLSIALSATDVVGHLYGPFSSEGEDSLRRLDRELGSFLAWLDDRFGKGRVTMVLTSDHGVATLPEWQVEEGTSRCPAESARVGIYGFVFRLYWYVYSEFTAPFGMPTDLVKFAGQRVSVNPVYAKELGLDVDTVIDGLKHHLEQEPSIKQAWTRAEINADTPLDQEQATEHRRLYQNSLVDDKSGDLIVQVHPGCVIRGSHGTGHGTPYDYDRNIPLVFYGQGVEPGRIGGQAHSVDIAPSLGELLGLELPADLDGRQLPLRGSR